MDRREISRRPAHPVAIRVMHWIGVYAMGCMIFSGWEIYNASPSLPFLFPAWAGLGGWLRARSGVSGSMSCGPACRGATFCVLGSGRLGPGRLASPSRAPCGPA